MKCQFEPAWTMCNNDAQPHKWFCKEHLNKKCGVCGGQANRECDATFSLVCGFPLCQKCIAYNSSKTHSHGPKCTWNGYYHSCKKQPLEGKKTCKEHSGVKCKCGRDAIRECPTSWQFACGRPLCDLCQPCGSDGRHETHDQFEKELDEAMVFHRKQSEIRRQQKKNS